MAKKDKDSIVDPEAVDPFVGSEDDDLMDMKYVQDEKTVAMDTHPPETKEEADLIAERAVAEAEKEKDEPEEEEEKEPEAKEEEKEDGEEADEEKESEAEAEVLDGELQIPKDRFDEVNERMKNAEGEVKSLKAQLEIVVEEKTPEPEPDPYDFASKEKEAMDALLEGDQDKYAEIRSEIRVAERDETLREARKISAQGDSELQETLTFEEAGAVIEGDYPQFVESSESYDSVAREEMLDLFVGYAKSGRYTRVQALQRAADKAAKMYGLTAVSAQEKEIDDPKKVVDIKTGDPKKKAEAANNQPPIMETTHGGKSEEPKIDVPSMSDEEFDALPETTKSRLRGDVV